MGGFSGGSSTGPGGVLPLGNLGDILVWDGTSWVATNLGSIPGDVIIWNGNGWVPASAYPTDTNGVYLGPSPKIHIVGDSITSGANELETGYVGGWRHPMYVALRNQRDDFELIGSFRDVAEQISSEGGWFHNALAGQTIPAAAGAYAGWIAAINETPGFIIDMIGTNDIMAGVGAAAMMIDRLALESVYLANAPGANLIALGLPPFVAGTTTGANLAVWNAVRVAYNALLQAHCAANPLTHQYVSTDVVGPGEYQPGGVHFNQQGEAVIGQLVAEVISKRLGPPKQQAIPRIFRQRQSWGTGNLPTNVSSFGAAAHAGFNPGVDSFAVAFDWYPRELPGGFQCVCGYNAIAARPDWWAIYQTGKALQAEFGTGAGVIGGGVTPSDFALQTEQWYRIVLIAYANGANSSLGLYVNGRLVGLATGMAAWNFGAHAFALGTTPGIVGVISLYGNLHTYKGPTIPKPGSLAALRAAEADYYLGRALVPGASAASFSINVSLADQISGNPPLVAGGAGALLAAWPGGSPNRPWEYPANNDIIPVPLGGGAAPVLGTIGGAGPAVAAQNSWKRETDAAGVVYYVPVWK